MGQDHAFEKRLGGNGGSAVLLAIAGVLVIVVGVGLLADDPPGTRGEPSAASPPADPRPAPLTPAPREPAPRDETAGDGSLHPISVAFGESRFRLDVSDGWKWGIGSYLTWAPPGSADADAEALVFWTAYPASADVRCPGLIRDSVSTNELRRDIAAAPGVELMAGPSEVVVGGYTATHLKMEVEDDQGCDPGYFYAWDPARGWHDTRDGDGIAVWIVDVEGSRLFVEAVTRPGMASGLEREIGDIVEQLVIGLARPAALPPEPWSFPAAGPLEVGWYAIPVASHATLECCRDAFTFLLRIPSRGWVSSGPAGGGFAGSISRGTVGAPGWLSIGFGNPDWVYADACTGEPGPPVGSSVGELVKAVSGIAGADARRFGDVRLRHSTAEGVMLRRDESAACTDADFALWHDGARGRRTLAAPGSQVFLLVFNPNDRPIFGRIAIDVEIGRNLPERIGREVGWILRSIDHGG